MLPYHNLNELLDCFDSLSYGHSCAYWGEKDPEELVFSVKRHFGRLVANQSLMKIDPWKSPLFRKRSGNHARLGFKLFEQLSADETR
jgi:acyl-CoA reductase-like NAD-dependent aldehyde dehydrogenase